VRAGALRSRAIGYFVEPGAPVRGAGEPLSSLRSAEARTLGSAAVAAGASRGGATRLPLRAAVLGAAPAATAAAGALACALRAAARSSTAAVAVWAPDGRSGVPPRLGAAPSAPRPVAGVPPRHGSETTATRRGSGAAPRRGPATPAAARLAARLSARGFAAAARGRLAWVALDDHPVAAAVAARRVAGALEVPLVTVVGGPRCEVVDGLLAEQDLVLVVAEEPEGPLARLAVESCTAAALACGPLAAGAARCLALGGLAGPRALAGPVRELVRDLAEPPALELEELRW